MSANNFVWYELVTSDVDAALGFYGKLLGWEAQEFPGGGRYMIVSASGKGVGGVMTLPEGMSHPFWNGYVGTPDIDAATSGFTSAGGAVHRAWEIPGVGRLALVSDPQGVGISMIQAAGDRPSEAFDQGLPGHGNWHELHTPDLDAAVGFYTEQFGWTKDTAMDMGAMGVYQIFKADDRQIGGMMKLAEPMRPMWLYYFGVRGVDAAVTAITEGGGKVLHGPAEVPGGAFIVQAADPQGALFAVVGPR